MSILQATERTDRPAERSSILLPLFFYHHFRLLGIPLSLSPTSEEGNEGRFCRKARNSFKINLSFGQHIHFLATIVFSRVIGDSFADIFAPFLATDIPFLLLHKTDVSFVLSPLLPPSPERGEGKHWKVAAAVAVSASCHKRGKKDGGEGGRHPTERSGRRRRRRVMDFSKMGLLGLPHVALAFSLPSRPFAYCFFYGARGASPPSPLWTITSFRRKNLLSYVQYKPSQHACCRARWENSSPN